MAEITKTASTYIKQFDRQETLDLADGAIAVAILAGLIPDPTVTKVAAAAAGLIGVGVRVAARRGYSLKVFGSRIRGISVGTPMAIPVRAA